MSLKRQNNYKVSSGQLNEGPLNKVHKLLTLQGANQAIMIILKKLRNLGELILSTRATDDFKLITHSLRLLFPFISSKLET